jgi:hypothetical protein
MVHPKLAPFKQHIPANPNYRLWVCWNPKLKAGHFHAPGLRPESIQILKSIHDLNVLKLKYVQNSNSF